MTSNDYKCRAETGGDIARVRDAWVKEGVKIESETITRGTYHGWDPVANEPVEVALPDCEWDVRVSSAHTLDDLVRIAKTLSDGHVIVETLTRKEDYTGERTYGK